MVPVTSGGKSFLKLNVKEPNMPFRTPEKTVIHNTRGMPPTWAAIMQAARAAESDTDNDWKPEPIHRLGKVCSIPVIPMEKRAVERREVDKVKSSPTVLATEMGNAIPNDTMSNMCCNEEKNKGPLGGTCDDE